VKTLVAFFSASGETQKLAKTLAGAVGGTLYQIRPAVEYTPADLDWHDKYSRSSVEMQDPTCRPALAGRVENINQYDTIFVGFPIWWYEAPRVIQTFLESYDLAGKTVIPFATSGGSDMGNTDSILQRSAPKAGWKLGKRLRATTSAQEITDWLKALK
jgi:flavodoxin